MDKTQIAEAITEFVQLRLADSMDDVDATISHLQYRYTRMQELSDIMGEDITKVAAALADEICGLTPLLASGAANV